MKILTIALFFLLTACSSVPVTTTDKKTAAEPPAAPVTTAPPVVAAPPVTVAPNILLIISDDQRYDTMEFMPETKKLIFDAGVTFTKAYVTTSLRCVSRASIFTGLYGYHHGVHKNEDALLKPTVMQALHEHGYFTGLVGKYLNSWDPGRPRPEFDRWVEFSHQGWGPASRGATKGEQKSAYLNPWINVDGEWRHPGGYLTYLQRDYAIEFLRDAARRKKPFFLLFAPFAPHGPAEPAPEDAGLYRNLPPYRPPSFNEQDVSDKPVWIQRHSYADTDAIDRFRIKQLRTLRSLDRSVAALLEELRRLEMLDNTVVIYISDNALLWGEHRLTKKDKVYEESIHVPFAVRFPKLTMHGRTDTHLVANMDIAPTLYQLAGLRMPAELDGRSLVPLLEGADTSWREDLVIESWPTNYPAFFALHTGRYVFVRTVGDRDELYDLRKDPYQLANVVDDPAYRPIAADLRKRLGRLRHEKDYQRSTAPLDKWGD